jgi:hypothetical protein
MINTNKTNLMKQVLLFCCSLFVIASTHAQDIAVRVRQVSFSAVDPDGAGPAKGSVTFRFELKSSSTDVLADGMGLSVVYQSAALMATPTNTVVKLGPINTPMWSQQVDNRIGNAITSVTYGGQSFDKRMIVTFNQNVGVPDAIIGSTWTEVAQLTYYTLAAGEPQGGYIVPEPGTVVAQNELSSDGGLTTYPYLSPEAGTPVALGAGVSTLPVQFVQFNAQCSPNGNSLTWSTASEKDNSYFEMQKSTDGVNWSAIGRLNGNGNSSTIKSYEFTDNKGGTAHYRIKQVDLNGSVSYSVITRTNCSTSAFFVNLYPIPAKDKITLALNSDKVIKTNVYVVDNSGRMVLDVPVFLHKGLNNFTLDVSHLSQGQYYLQSAKEGLNINQRFTITR